MAPTCPFPALWRPPFLSKNCCSGAHLLVFVYWLYLMSCLQVLPCFLLLLLYCPASLGSYTRPVLPRCVRQEVGPLHVCMPHAMHMRKIRNQHTFPFLSILCSLFFFVFFLRCFPYRASCWKNILLLFLFHTACLYLFCTVLLAPVYLAARTRFCIRFFSLCVLPRSSFLHSFGVITAPMHSNTYHIPCAPALCKAYSLRLFQACFEMLPHVFPVAYPLIAAVWGIFSRASLTSSAKVRLGCMYFTNSFSLVFSLFSAFARTCSSFLGFCSLVRLFLAMFAPHYL